MRCWVTAARAHGILGGPRGRQFELVAGDVVVPSAGTGDCNAGSDPDLLVVGAYPNAMRWDIRRGDPAERDPVQGRTDCWSRCGGGWPEGRLGPGWTGAAS